MKTEDIVLIGAVGLGFLYVYQTSGVKKVVDTAGNVISSTVERTSEVYTEITRAPTIQEATAGNKSNVYGGGEFKDNYKVAKVEQSQLDEKYILIRTLNEDGSITTYRTLYDTLTDSEKRAIKNDTITVDNRGILSTTILPQGDIKPKSKSLKDKAIESAGRTASLFVAPALAGAYALSKISGLSEASIGSIVSRSLKEGIIPSVSASESESISTSLSSGTATSRALKDSTTPRITGGGAYDALASAYESSGGKGKVSDYFGSKSKSLKK